MLDLRSSRFCLAACLWIACAVAAVSAPAARVPPPSVAKPKTKMLTPQDAAFLKAINDNNAAFVRQSLQINPALANLPSTYDDNSGITTDAPLFEAAGIASSYFDDTQVVLLLLKAGAKINAEDGGRETALDQAAFYGGKKTVALLLAHGAAIEHRDNLGRTALHGAISGDSADAVAVLLAHGANVNACDNKGRTPLAMVLDPSFHGFNRAVILKLLRQHGAKR